MLRNFEGELLMLSVESIDLHYSSSQALRNISVTAKAGAVTCVLGRNGVGIGRWVTPRRADQKFGYTTWIAARHTITISASITAIRVVLVRSVRREKRASRIMTPL